MVSEGDMFALVITELLVRQDSPTLQRRWDESTGFGLGESANAFWVRESDDVVNIIWLNGDGIRDITLLPPGGETMFNFLPLNNIATIEVREGEDVSGLFGIGVKGSFLVHVIITSNSVGNLYWIADSADHIAELRKFLGAVLTAYVGRQQA